MRFGILLLLTSAIVLVTACGGSTGASAAGPGPAPGKLLGTGAGSPSLRALLPADLNGDGIADAPVHGSLRRLLVQAPANAKVSLMRGGEAVAFKENRTYTMPGGEVVFEIELESPLGDQPCTLRAAGYEMRLLPSFDFAEQQDLALRPARTGALAGDLVNPAAAVFETPADVQLVVSGPLPTFFGPRLNLVCGDGEPIELDPGISARGITLTPKRAPLAGRAYRLAPAQPMTDAYGRGLEPNFHLAVRAAGVLAICCADINRDGQDDLVFLDREGRVTAMTDPAQTPVDIPLAMNGKGLSLATGDFDGNGAVDLAVLMQVQDGYKLLRLFNETRQSKLMFAIRPAAVQLDAPFKLLAGDFDRDGHCDLAIAGCFGALQFQYSTLPPRTLPGLLENVLCLDALALDHDRDGNLDVALFAADGKCRVLPGKGDSPLPAQPKLTVVETKGATRLRCADFDADNKPDFVLSGGTRNCGLVAGGGHRALPIMREAEEIQALAGAVCARDLTGNKRQDLLAVREDSRGLLTGFAAFINNGEGLPAQPDVVMPVTGGYAINCLEYWREHVFLGGELGLYIMPTGRFEVPMRALTRVRFIEAYAPIPQLPAPLSAAVADFDGNGKVDIAALDANGKLTLWLAGEAGEKFAPSTTTIALGGPGRLQAVDFDRDSFPDILFIPADTGARPQLLRNNRGGGLSEDWEGLLPTPPRDLRGAPALGDFDLDGDLDCLWPTPVGRLQYSDGHGRWRDGPSLPVVREGGRVLYFSGELCCANFGGRGRADVAAVMQPEDGSEQFLVLFEGTGREDEPFIAHLSPALRGRIFDLTPGEFSNDQMLDLAVGFARVGEAARLTLLQLAADGAFAVFEGTPSPRGELLDMTLDDLDGDGDLDLVISENVEGKPVVGLWINNGKGGFVEGGPADESLRAALGEFAATNLSLADFTGDGRPDLLALDKDGNVVLLRSTIQS